MGTPHKIRSAKVADLDWCAERDAGVPLERLKNCIEAGDVLIGTHGGEPIGYLRVEWLWGKKPFLASIQISDGYQRCGLGTLLLQSLEAKLREAGAVRLLSSTMPDNVQSQNWHRKQGFRESGFLAGINRGNVGEIFYLKELSSS